MEVPAAQRSPSHGVSSRIVIELDSDSDAGDDDAMPPLTTAAQLPRALKTRRAVFERGSQRGRGTETLLELGIEASAWPERRQFSHAPVVIKSIEVIDGKIVMFEHEGQADTRISVCAFHGFGSKSPAAKQAALRVLHEAMA